MELSKCCGAPTQVVKRPDHPLIYDDVYDLQIPYLICTKCGKIIGLDEDKNPKNVGGEE